MKQRILLIILIVASVVCAIGAVMAGRNKKSAGDASQMAGYREINDVYGASFYVNQMFVDEATAITEVSDSVNFQRNQSYVYKNGTDKYLLFNMESLVVAAQKGTTFNLALEDPKARENALGKASLLNIWFEKGSRKFDCEVDGNRTVTKVIAGVPINTDLYGDFCGELATIEDENEEEWSLFVGVPGPRYDKLTKTDREGIEAIINTFRLSDNAELLDTDIYAVTVTGNDTTKEKVNTVDDTVEVTDTPSLNLTNQKIVQDKDDDKAYSSSIYNMLDIGDNGILSAFNENFLGYEEPIIHVSAVRRGEEAKKIIKKYCASGDSFYKYFEPPEGCNWQVVEYDLNYKNCKDSDYVDIKMRGMDGEKLRHRGIRYTQRSYTIDDLVKADGSWLRGYMAFYAVPNGCYEYALECGENNPGLDAYPAWYHITEQRPTRKDEAVPDPGEDSVELAEEGGSRLEEDQEGADGNTPEANSEKTAADNADGTEPEESTETPEAPAQESSPDGEQPKAE